MSSNSGLKEFQPGKRMYPPGKRLPFKIGVTTIVNPYFLINISAVRDVLLIFIYSAHSFMISSFCSIGLKRLSQVWKDRTFDGWWSDRR